MTKAFDEEPRRGPIAIRSTPEPYLARDVVIPPSGPADPRQRVRNDSRQPEAYRDLTQKPDLTGTYFETGGRYRLFINHAGPHIECLLTLVVQHNRYHQPSPSSLTGRGKKREDSLRHDERLPFDWGIAGYLARPAATSRDPIAFRFAGDFLDGIYVLRVPVWLGSTTLDRSLIATDHVGTLHIVSRDKVRFEVAGWFVDRWPEADQTFGVAAPAEELTTFAVRSDRNPVLLERYLGRDSVPFHVRTHYWFPITPQQIVSIDALAKSVMNRVVRVDPTSYRLSESDDGTLMDLYELLDAERRLGSSLNEEHRRDNIVTAIDSIVGALFREALTTPISRGGMGLADLGSLRVRTLRVLDGWHLLADAERGTQSIATALQRAVESVSSHATVGKLERYLGIASRGWRPLRFEISVVASRLLEFSNPDVQDAYDDVTDALALIQDKIEETVGKKYPIVAKYRAIARYFPLTYIFAFAHVRYLGSAEDSGGASDAPWSAIYMIALGGLKWSASIGELPSFELSGPGRGWMSRTPTKEDLEGPVTYAEGNLSAGLHLDLGDAGGEFDVRLGRAKSMLSFLGPTGGSQSATAFLFDGAMGDNAAGAGAAGKSVVGYAWLIGGDDAKIDVAPKTREEVAEFSNYWSDRIPGLAVHFPINGAKLPVPTEKERQWMEAEGLITVKEALEAFAACELPLLANPLAAIAFEGHADPPDEAKRNSALSKARADSVRNYLHSLLGDTLTWGLAYESLTTNGRLVSHGFGEPEPSGTGGSFDPQERRVDVVVELRAPGTPTDSESGAAAMKFPLIRHPSTDR